ncbi:hypothetical protein KKF73_05065 [Patescibacteria group bacterium]|nr:hypothetical protein [Patescibacteria group bacterium]
MHEICIFLRGILQCEVEYFHSMKAKEVKDLLDNHLVVVGGPMWNDYTNKLMKDYKLPFQYKCQEGEEDYILNEINNKEYRVSKTRKNGREMITGDYGIFAVLPNKENEDKTVILISGIRSFGGLGATRSFTEGTIPYENCKLIVKTVGLKNYFATLIEIDVPWGEFPYPKKIKQSDTFAYSPEEKLWKVIV